MTNWMVRRPNNKRTIGFTLIELAAVMVLVAILAVGTAISLRGQLAAVRLESTLDKIEALDRMTRGQAMRERHHE